MLKRMLSILLVIGIFLLCGCSGKSGSFWGKDDAAQQNEAGVITLFSYKPDTLCPIASNNQANIRMLDIVYEGLVSLDESLIPNPCLATDWSVSQDGLSWTVNLRKDVKWHSGEAFVANDVVYTVNSIKNLESSPYLYNVSRISNIAAKGQNQLVITLDSQNVNFMNLMYFPIIKSGGALNTENFKVDGTGPYKYEAEGEGSTLHLTANDNWWGGGPISSTINVKIMPNSDTALYGFSSSGVDLVPADNLDWGKFVDPAISSYVSFPTPVYNFLGINHTDSSLKHSELREAISLVIDREALVQEAMTGYATAANTPIRKEWYAYGNQAYTHKVDTEKAKAVLEDAGWVFEAGMYRKFDGENSSVAAFEILVNEGNSVREQIADMLSTKLSGFGIKVNVTKLPYEEYLSRISEGEYDAFVGSMSISPDLNFSGIFGEGNIFGYENEEMFSVISGIQGKKTEESLKTAYAEFINLFEQTNPVVGLFFEDSVMLHTKLLNPEEIKPSYFDVYKGIESMKKGEA